METEGGGGQAHIKQLLAGAIGAVCHFTCSAEAGYHCRIGSQIWGAGTSIFIPSLFPIDFGAFLSMFCISSSLFDL
jgi:hypothetical protein